MNFYGIVKKDSAYFMLGFPIMGIIYDKQRIGVGAITGTIDDINSFYVLQRQYDDIDKDVKETIESLLEDFNDDKDYTLERCTYKEACKRTLDEYGESDTILMPSVGATDIEFNLSLIKNKLREICEC